MGFHLSRGFVDLDKQIFSATAILPVSHDGDVSHVSFYFSSVRIAIAQVETRAFRHRYDHAGGHHVGKFLSTSRGQAGQRDFAIGASAEITVLVLGRGEPLNKVFQVIIGDACTGPQVGLNSQAVTDPLQWKIVEPGKQKLLRIQLCI